MNTNITDMYEYLEHVIKQTNMKSITPFTEEDQVFTNSTSQSQMFILNLCNSVGIVEHANVKTS